MHVHVIFDNDSDFETINDEKFVFLGEEVEGQTVYYYIILITKW